MIKGYRDVIPQRDDIPATFGSVALARCERTSDLAGLNAAALTTSVPTCQV